MSNGKEGNRFDTKGACVHSRVRVLESLRQDFLNWDAIKEKKKKKGKERKNLERHFQETLMVPVIQICQNSVSPVSVEISKHVTCATNNKITQILAS